MNGKHQNAKKLFEWIYSDSVDREERYNYLNKTIEEERSQQHADKARYLECFQGTNLKRTFTIMFLFGIVNIGGGPFLGQSIYFLISVGLPAIHVFDIAVGFFGLAIIIIIASGFLLKNYRRNHILFWGTVINLVFNLVIGALYYGHGDGPKWAIAILM